MKLARTLSIPFLPGTMSILPIVAVAAGGGRSCRAHTDQRSSQHPRALARRKAWREQPVVDLTRHRKSIEHRRWEEQPRVVSETIRRGVDIALHRTDDAVAVLVHPCDLDGVGGVQPPLEVLYAREERGGSFIDVQEHFVGETTWDGTLASFSLGVN